MTDIADIAIRIESITRDSETVRAVWAMAVF